MNDTLIKQALDIPFNTRIIVTQVSNGWNIRIRKTKKPKIHKKNKEEMVIAQCRKCGRVTYCHYHHIYPVGAGGGDERENRLSLCFDDHVGDNGIHKGKWKIEEILTVNELQYRREVYGK